MPTSFPLKGFVGFEAYSQSRPEGLWLRSPAASRGTHQLSQAIAICAMGLNLHRILNSAGGVFRAALKAETPNGVQHLKTVNNKPNQKLHFYLKFYRTCYW
ncbi:MAG: hypothetical protein ACHBN1_00115 [Heteroscytonema crispum UTEX LB 1556]